MNRFNQSLDEILFWMTRKGIDHLRESFFHPQTALFSDSSDTLPVLSSTLDVLPQQEKKLFSCFCLACLALDPRRLPTETGEEIVHSAMLHDPGLELQPEDILYRTWLKSPLVLAGPESAGITWALLSRGPGPCHPGWLPKVMGDESIRALALAAELAGLGQDHYFWPILDFTSCRILISGRSLGLPVYLGLRSLKEGLENPRIAATGSLEKTGLLTSVHDLELKAKACRRHGLNALICPDQEVPAHPDMEYIRVKDIGQAWSAWKHHIPDCRFGAYLALCRDIQRAKDNLFSLPTAVLKHLKQTGALFPIMDEVLHDTDALEGFVFSLKKEIRKPDWDSGRIPILLDMIEPESLPQKVADPLLFYDLALLQRFKCNHLGRVGEARKWSGVCGQLEETLILHSDSETRILDDFNLKIVQDHNRYCFYPYRAVAAEYVAEVLDLARQKFESREKTKGAALSPALGALYGTLTQNFAFCGPGYLEQTLDAARQAMRFFGQGRFPGRSRQDYLRQHCYLFYAYLDAELPEKTFEHLMNYLELDSLENFDASEPNPYKHACVMRLLSEGRASLPTYVSQAEMIISRVPMQHPWQLWLKNLARVSCHKDVQEYCLRKSIDICMEFKDLQVTMVPMALQGLSLLHKYRLEHPDTVVNKINQIKTYVMSSGLDQKHFRPFTEILPGHDGLLQISLLTRELFPFSYR